MSFTIQDAKNSLEGMLHGATLNKVRNLNDVFRRAAYNMLIKVDPPETMRWQQITNAVHDEIYDYSCPSDLKGDKIIDIRPQVNRTRADAFGQRHLQAFDLHKALETFSILHNNAEKTLRLSASIAGSPITLHTMDSITDNGNWVAGGGATNLTVDSIEYMSGNACLNFDLAVGGSAGYIEISDMTDIDLEDYDEVGSFWVRLYLPAPSIITNIILRWGNDSSNYWHATSTYPHDVSSFKTGRQILRFDWNGATEVGTVDPSAIDYLRATITYDGTAETDIRIDKITYSKGEIYELGYYSAYLFRSSAGTWAGTTNDDSDIVNLGSDGYPIFLNECLLAIAQQMQGKDAGFDVGFVKGELYGDGGKNKGLYSAYKKHNQSQAIKKVQQYWRHQTYA